MLFRKKMIELINWKNNEDTSLLVKGARQVGKTRLIEEFIKNEFSNYIEIDFSKDANALSLLLDITNYDDLLNRLSLISNVDITKSNSILFLDEIQYYYEQRAKRIEKDPSFKDRTVDIITLSKTIADKKEFRLIMSGSVLGVSIFDINFNPTGYLKEITMYPMDFEEFLLANEVKQNIIDEVRLSFLEKKPVPESLNNYLLAKFKEYVLVGGLPKAVDGYVHDKTFVATDDALEVVDKWYKEDIIKYSKIEDRLVILEMYNILPNEITMKNRKFVKSHLDVPDFKNIDLKDRFLWLQSAGIAIPTYNVTNPIYPLRISTDNKIVKLFMNDVGLLSHQLFTSDAKRKILIDSKDVDLGSLYENAVAELLISHRFNPYFHSTKKRGEVDFIVEKNMTVYPLEIKSGLPDKKDGTYSHSALTNLLSAHEEIKEAMLFGECNVRQENSLITMYPIYMIDFFIK